VKRVYHDVLVDSTQDSTYGPCANKLSALFGKFKRPTFVRDTCLHHTTMPPRLNIIPFTRSIPYRPRPSPQWLVRPVTRTTPSYDRAYSDSKNSSADRSKRIDTQPLDHVSAEAAELAKITGSQGPEVEEQGTPVEEVGESIPWF